MNDAVRIENMVKSYNQTPIINIEHLKKSFGSKQVLNDINCSVYEREIFGLLGPSGAGKTTIINILIGQLKANAGQAKVFGTNTDSLTDEIHSKIGIVLDDHGLYSRLSCYDNLMIFVEIHGVSKTRIADVLEKVKLIDSAKKPVSRLSKGMTQRLVLARAILHKPKLLFLDEPTSGLDPVTAQEIHKLIFELRENDTTVFLTTHNMEEAAKLCDNVALLNEGKIVEYGNPDALCRKYNTKKNVQILLKEGQPVELPIDSTSAHTIAEFFAKESVVSIHSSEPNLETVFISLTGRNLV